MIRGACLPDSAKQICHSNLLGRLSPTKELINMPPHQGKDPRAFTTGECVEIKVTATLSK